MCDLEISTNIFTIVDISSNKIKYKGYYGNNQRNGNGKTFYENGNIRYDGEWTNDKRNGNCIIYDENNNILYDGKFKDNKMI